MTFLKLLVIGLSLSAGAFALALAHDAPETVESPTSRPDGGLPRLPDLSGRPERTATIDN